MLNSDRMSVFNSFCYPKSVAVIGVSTNDQSFGTRQLNSLIKFGYKGRLYPVNPRGGEFYGLKAYQSVGDIPESPDLAIIAVPAQAVVGVAEECFMKGVNVIEVLSAGFGESGDEGHRLEERLANIAAKGIRIMGPNCFGVYCPDGRVTILPGAYFAKESGSVGLVSQSGQFAEMISLQSTSHGIRFSKVISYGNACDLNECDYLEYLAEDRDTKIILAYIEGVKEGRRFLEIVRKISTTKPVIMWKVGLTQAGSRAASSHTGSLGGEESVWNAFFIQSGAIRVNSMEELIDTTVAFLHLPHLSGSRVGLVSGGGGGTVIGADACERLGLSIPLFSKEIQIKVGSLIPSAGASVKNPVDLATPMPLAQLLTSVLENIAASEEIDVIILRRVFLSVRGANLTFGWPVSPVSHEDEQELMNVPLKIKERFSKPIIVVLMEETSDLEKLEFEKDRRRLRDYYLTHGISVYPTLERAIIALAHLCKYKMQSARF